MQNSLHSYQCTRTSIQNVQDLTLKASNKILVLLELRYNTLLGMRLTLYQLNEMSH